MTRSTKRTPEELAAFKAANIARCNATRKTIIIEPKRTTPKFTVTWTTNEGRFGWFTTFASTPEAAADKFIQARNRGQVPFDADIELIKPGGQEL